MTTYKNTTDHAAEIRAAYKARGWTSRQISVRAEYFSLGSSIHVTLKDGRISLPMAQAIAERHERIDRCEITGEILSGGNRYVSLRVDEAAQTVKARPYVSVVEDAVGKLSTDTPAILEPIGETHYYVGRERNGALALWGDGGHITSSLNDAAAVAYALAIAHERADYLETT